MQFKFYKYHGAGNDFIFAEGISDKIITPAFISKICNRTRGIGADGLILADKNAGSGADLRMIYYNQDGSRGEMCGNGLRCTAFYAHTRLNLSAKLNILTDSGILFAENLAPGRIRIEIPVIEQFREISIDNSNVYFGNTGVPHAVIVRDSLDETDVFSEGRKLRYHKVFAPKGTNVDFVCPIKRDDNTYLVLTYERDVENETGACGTGISATAVSLFIYKKVNSPIKFTNLSGDSLQVDLVPSDKLNKVFLTGPAEEICSGTCIF